MGCWHLVLAVQPSTTGNGKSLEWDGEELQMEYARSVHLWNQAKSVTMSSHQKSCRFPAQVGHWRSETVAPRSILKVAPCRAPYSKCCQLARGRW
jgi:hypothetical protein